MPKRNEQIKTTIYFDTMDEKELVRNFLVNIKYKTGLNNGDILRRALMNFNMEFEYAKQKTLTD